MDKLVLLCPSCGERTVLCGKAKRDYWCTNCGAAFTLEFKGPEVYRLLQDLMFEMHQEELEELTRAGEILLGDKGVSHE
jgi:tRNA(Ile2) C34 agmatinyltransferase TiaS